MPETYLFNEENILLQLQSAPYALGYYTLRFYSDQGRPVNRISSTIDDFYLYPSGGTLRDCTFTIVMYDSRFDTYRGFVPPHIHRDGSPMRQSPSAAGVLREHVPLAPLTTLQLGGNARYFMECTTRDDIRSGLEAARSMGLPVFILGGGSNLVVHDRGVDGVVLHMATRGMTRTQSGQDVEVRVEAGEPWDDVVASSVGHGDAGLECLSGIPGSAGATPIQNVGAYGQDVSQVITCVDAIDIATLNDIRFSPRECLFGYRSSRFKQQDAGKFIVTSVTFALQAQGRPTVRYPELQRLLAGSDPSRVPGPGEAGLMKVREGVLALRRKKSMVTDVADPNSRSAGSFFTNPIVSPDAFAALQRQWPDIPSFPAEGGVKISAAWLVEHAGFPRGFRMGGAAISDHHALALVNRGTTSRELLQLAERIREGVHARFGIALQPEPVII